MAITAPAAHSPVSSSWAGQVTAALTPTWWTGGLTGTASHTSSKYLSLKYDTKIDGENLTPTFDGDCVKVPTAGVYDIVASFREPGTSGEKRLILMLNPDVTSAANQSALPTGTSLVDMTAPATSDASPTVSTPPIRRRLATTDKLMVCVYQTSGSSQTVAVSAARCFIQLTRVPGE